MSLIELDYISKDNVQVLYSEAFISNYFLRSMNEQEQKENFTNIMNKAKELNVYDMVFNAFKKANDEQWHVPLPLLSLKYTSLSNIESQRTEWLWKPYIPLGKITLMTADPGTGKTFFSLYIAAAVSDGRPFFGQDCSYTRSPRTVIYQTAEDGIADTIKPRLEPMNPNFNNISIIDETYEQISLSDSERIEQAMKDLNPALMIFDPLQAYLGADVDMFKANEVRPVLARIGQLAERYKCSVIFIMHNNKMSQAKALFRTLGSIDIPAVARSMLVMGNHPEKPDIKVLCHEKSSLAKHGQSIEFEIDPSRGGIIFAGFSELKAADILNVVKNTRNKPSVAKNEAQEALLELLGDKGYAKLDDIKQLQEEIGCSQKTLYRAKDDLQLDNVSIGFSKDKVTYWIAPDVNKEEFKVQKDKELLEEFTDILS